MSKKLADIFDEKTMTQIARFFSRVAEDYKIDEAYLFGSHADGTHKDGSDIDMAVVSDAIKNSQDKHNIFLRARACNHRIHVHSFGKQEFVAKESNVVEAIKSGIPIDVAKVLKSSGRGSEWETQKL